MKFNQLKLKVLDQEFKYVLLDGIKDASTIFMSESTPSPFALFVNTDEISAIVPSTTIVKADKEESDWKCIRIIGEMPFGTVQGLIAKVSNSLISESIGICVVSTFKTDWFFIKQMNLEKAMIRLKKDGWEFLF